MKLAPTKIGVHPGKSAAIQKWTAEWKVLSHTIIVPKFATDFPSESSISLAVD